MSAPKIDQSKVRTALADESCDGFMVDLIIADGHITFVEVRDNWEEKWMLTQACVEGEFNVDTIAALLGELIELSKK